VVLGQRGCLETLPKDLAHVVRLNRLAGSRAEYPLRQRLPPVTRHPGGEAHLEAPQEFRQLVGHCHDPTVARLRAADLTIGGQGALYVDGSIREVQVIPLKAKGFTETEASPVSWRGVEGPSGVEHRGHLIPDDGEKRVGIVVHRHSPFFWN
jgi:hypothetical protein